MAERVAEERCERVGGVVGYSIRLERKRSRRTRLLFCTTVGAFRRKCPPPYLPSPHNGHYVWG